MAHTVVAVYDDYTQAQRALNALTESGFAIEDVKLNPQEQSTDARQSALRSDGDHQDGGGSGIMGFFRSLFGTDDDDSRHGDVYSEAVRRGSYLLTVHSNSDDQADRACDILNRYDPVDIDDRATQWKSEGWSGYDTSASAFSDDEITQDRSRYASSGVTGISTQNTMDNATASRLQDTTGGSVEGETRIPVVQEELQIGKRSVQRGGVRVFQRVIDTPVHEQVQLREEHVTIERRPVDEPASAADMAALKEGSFEMRETAEEAVVGKSARVVEEVVVNKEVSERTQAVDDTVRRTEVEVEQLGRGEAMAATRDMSDDDTYFRNHWQTNFGNSGGRYEDYAPAYRFGSQMRNDARYNQYQWNDAEPDLRSGWEQQYGKSDNSTWDRMKGAVRHGWDRVTK